MPSRLFYRLSQISVALALCVVVLGAYVRLSDAGLGCPDWPGCYGRLDVPVKSQHIAEANAAYPQRPVDVAKAWKEMAHRYFAGALGLLILALAIVAWRRRHQPSRCAMTMTGFKSNVTVHMPSKAWKLTNTSKNKGSATGWPG